MRKTKKTDLVQDLMKRGASYPNAYRIVYKSKGQAARLLVSVLRELLILKGSIKE